MLNRLAASRAQRNDADMDMKVLLEQITVDLLIVHNLPKCPAALPMVLRLVSMLLSKAGMHSPDNSGVLTPSTLWCVDLAHHACVNGNHVCMMCHSPYVHMSVVWTKGMFGILADDVVQCAWPVWTCWGSLLHSSALRPFKQTARQRRWQACSDSMVSDCCTFSPYMSYTTTTPPASVCCEGVMLPVS